MDWKEFADKMNQDEASFLRAESNTWREHVVYALERLRYGWRPKSYGFRLSAKRDKKAIKAFFKKCGVESFGF